MLNNYGFFGKHLNGNELFIWNYILIWEFVGGIIDLFAENRKRDEGGWDEHFEWIWKIKTFGSNSLSKRLSIWYLLAWSFKAHEKSEIYDHFIVDLLQI